MRLLLAACLIPLVLPACGNHVSPIGLHERARNLTELIERDDGCATFRIQLGQTFTERSQIEAIYAQAKAAGCIRRDI